MQELNQKQLSEILNNFLIAKNITHRKFAEMYQTNQGEVSHMRKGYREIDPMKLEEICIEWSFDLPHILNYC